MTTEEYNYLLNTLKKYIPKQDVEDVLQEVLVQIYSDDKYPKDTAYILRACYKSYYSKTSPYAYTKGITCVDEFPEIPYEEEEVVDIDKIIKWVEDIKELSWWEKQCFLRKILEDKTFKELSKEYNEAQANIGYSFRKAKKIIQKLWEEKENK